MNDMMPDPNITQQDVQRFLIVTIAIALNTFDIAFNLGVYETIFFNRVFAAWVITLVVLIASFFLPEDRLPIGRAGQVLLAAPTLVIVLDILLQIGVFGDSPSDDFVRFITVLQIAMAVIGVPYAIYKVLIITNPDIEWLDRRRMGSLFAVIILAIGLIGFLVGDNHPGFLTCYDFRISGNDVPADCDDSDGLIEAVTELVVMGE